MNPQQINIEEYTYTLSDERIAKYPLTKRDESKLLIYESGNIKENTFKKIAEYIPKNSLLVANNTKVIRARLEFFKATGARIEVFCLEPYEPVDYNLNFASTVRCKWLCIVGNLKKWKDGILTKDIKIFGKNTTLSIEKSEKIGDAHLITFNWNNSEITFSEILENLGNIPIPPYLNRNAEKSDLNTYQTIYSKHKGSVAAPTAGLHFTDDVFTSFEAKNIKKHEVTLHVGAGTFKPVKTQTIGEHDMHTEHFIITKKTIPPLLENLGSITAVGTTTVRTLESLYWLGVKLIQNITPIGEELHLNQWDAYKLNNNIKVNEALLKLHNYVENSMSDHINASTAIMIAPGYKFKIINRLITNFHQPKSTLLLLISAFVGKDWNKIYQYALDNKFRFLSYGDSCLLNKKLEL